ncbi:MAG: PQQ-dependent sugar dehydrogenase [Gammaproteobacteria bacterium]|nr:PQQ-dependent sugar dehydrogenase [Gammaproteobacteria bacterium]
MLKVVIRFVVCLLCIFIGVLGSAQARNEYLGWWAEVYTSSNANQSACQLCHERTGGGNGWNKYGWSLRSALNMQSAPESILKGALDDVQNVDDGNGSSYLMQINNDAQPGWFVGNNNRIRSVGIDDNGQPIAIEKFIDAGDVQPCGIFIDPPNSSDAQEIKRVQTCSTVNPIDSTIDKAGPKVRLDVVAGGFTAPLSAVSAPGQSNIIYVVEQGGLIWRVDLQNNSRRVFLDFSGELVTNFGQLSGGYDERGLLGFAFHPNFANNNLIYTYISTNFDASQIDFSTLGIGETADHMSEVAEWVVTNPADVSSSAGSKRRLLAVAQPQSNHNGGMLAFGPEGYLYIALGDGGASNDAGDGHGVEGNARDNTNILGSILRIDIDHATPANGRYAVPVDNPFVGSLGADEIYVYGLRNPYRFSIEGTGAQARLYIGDVGQDAIEELNRIPLDQGGANFGWNYKEGSFFFSVIGGSSFVSPTPPSGVVIPALIDPVTEYDHNEGISIIAGYNYDGNDIPELSGSYIFGDWGRSFVNPDGRLFFLDPSDQIRELDLVNPLNIHVTGFGRDSQGEVYVVGSTGFSVNSQGQGSLLKLAPVTDDEICTPIRAKNGKVALICL